jgi:RNA polymerase sigma factor (sigma-70 family)
MATDNHLLQHYADSGSEPAFRELVERRIGLVYSAALREAGGDAAWAQDITQAVFTELARKAKALVRHPALSGWLYTCARRMSANDRRADQRRQRREQEAFAMNEILGSDPTDHLWPQVRPLLDDVMHELSPEDRTAVVLRFFEGRNLREVGHALGLTENAARMRVDRALERLRWALSHRGVKSTASTLAAVLAAGAVATAPSSLASTVATGALTAAAASTMSGGTFAGWVRLAKPKAVLIGASLVFLTLALAWRQFRSHQIWSHHDAQAQITDSTALPAGTSSGLQGSPADGKAVASVPAASEMALHVVEAETGEPLPDTKLYLFYLYEYGRGKVVRSATGAGGRASVARVHKPFYGLNLFVTADGHVPKVVSWGFGHTMPFAYTLRLQRGISIGGMVVDEARHPIAGVSIQFNGPGNDIDASENIQFGPDTRTTTDAAGRWSCNMVPEALHELSLVLTDPEHAETEVTIRPHEPEATNSVITMLRGFNVAGTVQDANGTPIPGAKVRQVLLNSEGERSETTGTDGSFEFKYMKTGELMLSVQANGFAPAVQTLQITGDVATAQFSLDPGQFLRGRVVDDQDKPVANAFVEVTPTGINPVQWSTNTDSQGRFTWNSAPQDPLRYSFLAEGFNRVYSLELKADGSEHEIKLTRKQPGRDTIRLAGTVQDADTGRPLDGFKVLLGRVDPDWAAPFTFLTAGTDGRFTITPAAASLYTNYQLQIEKAGYVPALSANLSVRAGNQDLQFELRKGSGPSGVVLLPSGFAAADATVFLCIPSAGVTLDGAAHVQRGINTTTYQTRTDEAGKFSLPAALDPQAVIILHDQGFAQLSIGQLAAGNAITLQPWGRIQGRVILDSEPAPNEHIIAYNQVFGFDGEGHRVGLLTVRVETTTDSAGHFAFEKMPPGEYTVFREKRREVGYFAGCESHDISAVLKAGEVTQVVLGGSGRPVTGKAVLAGATGPINWANVPVVLSQKPTSELGPFPSRHNFGSGAAFRAAMNRWDALQRERRRFGAFCDSSGSFRIPDVPAGTYELVIELLDFKLNSVNPRQRWEPAQRIGSIQREVVIPEASGDQPVDLGTLELLLPQAAAAAR